jgi:argininosuccinate lyase
MSDTGRIARPVSPEAAKIVFGEGPSEDLRGDLELIAVVDRAHLVMLAETGLVERPVVAGLLAAVERVAQGGFEGVLRAPRPRGLYLGYEAHLAELAGEEVAGVLHTGRSRNDLNATVQRLRARAAVRELLRSLAGLSEAILDRAERYRRLMIPAYSHYQVGSPITLGSYLLGIGWALLRDSRPLGSVLDELSLCPLGAGVGAGTTLPIDPRRTAELLGFEGTMPNPLEAVASRAFVLRVLGALVAIGVTGSRQAGDLLLWSTREFGFVELPDDLVGSSSMMPQKRNPFLLEHVQGRCAAPAGALVAAAGAMGSTPFANSVVVGTEAVAPLAGTLTAMTEAIELLRLVLMGVEPQPEAMKEAMRRGYGDATAVAEQLVRDGMPFRRAHHEVGRLVSEAGVTGSSLVEAARRSMPELAAAAEQVAEREVAVEGDEASRRALAAGWQGLGEEAESAERRWLAAEGELARAVAGLLAEHADEGPGGCPGPIE